jgi:hypothetical protein
MRASDAQNPAFRNRSMPVDHTLSLLRPLMWVAAVAFITGFGGYLAIGLSAANAG